MTAMTTTEPRLEWLEAAQQAVNADPGFRKLGSTDVVLGLSVGGEARLITFEAFRVTDVRTVPEVELRDAELVLKLSPEQWNAYLGDRKAGRGPTLLTLDLISRVFSAANPIARLKLARYNRSLQAYIDAGAGLAA